MTTVRRTDWAGRWAGLSVLGVALLAACSDPSPGSGPVTSTPLPAAEARDATETNADETVGNSSGVGTLAAFDGTTLHLNPWATNASDKNDGSQSAPLKSVQGAFDRILVLKKTGNVRVLMYPGTYRDYLVHGAGALGPDPQRVSWAIPRNQYRLVFEATQPGQVSISGSDIWTGWRRQGNVWTHAWPYNWGAPGAGPRARPEPDVSELAARRELIFLNGQRVRQVLSAGALTENSFYVDEAADRVSVRSSADLNTVKVEVGVRDQLAFFYNIPHVTLRGLLFKHSVDKFAQAAVTFFNGDGKEAPRDCQDILIENSAFSSNSQVGLTNYCDDFTVKRSRANGNGFQGISGAFAQRWLIEDSETSRNAWRSYAGGYNGWSTGGFKMFIAGNVTLRRHRALDNLGEGVWTDTRGDGFVLEQSVIARNKFSGVFLEATPGQMTVRDTVICDNGAQDILFAAVGKVLFERNKVIGRGQRVPEEPNPSTILFGETRRKVAAGSSYPGDLPGEFPLRGLTLRNNVFVAGPGRRLVDTYFYYKPGKPEDAEKQADYEAFVSSFRASGNTWYAEGDDRPFSLPTVQEGYNDARNFAAWKAIFPGQDLDSRLADPGLTCAALVKEPPR
jgi:Right handed beta helix region